MLLSADKLQLQIYYLYMLADGTVTEEESKRFSEICWSMNVDEFSKKEKISFCTNAIQNIGSDNSAKVIREIAKLLTNAMSNYSSINSDKQTQAKIIWTLINLGYADIEYSEPEQKVVSFLSDYWEINAAVMSDMIDTAETILMLTKKKEWLKTTNKHYDEISAGISEIDKTIEQMFHNIQILISEAEIA